MIKIKDDVDLRILKDTFKMITNDERGIITNRKNTLKINMWNRKIMFTPYDTFDDSTTVEELYDLIQAGLVEKIFKRISK